MIMLRPACDIYVIDSYLRIHYIDIRYVLYHCSSS